MRRSHQRNPMSNLSDPRTKPTPRFTGAPNEASTVPAPADATLSTPDVSVESGPASSALPDVKGSESGPSWASNPAPAAGISGGATPAGSPRRGERDPIGSMSGALASSRTRRIRPATRSATVGPRYPVPGSASLSRESACARVGPSPDETARARASCRNGSADSGWPLSSNVAPASRARAASASG